MVHTKRMSNSVIMSKIFGVRTASADPKESPHMHDLYDMMEKWSAVVEVGATPPVDVFPILHMLPEALFGNWIQRSVEVGKLMKTLYNSWQGKVDARRELAQKTGVKGEETFMDLVLNQQEKMPLTQNQRDFLGGVLMEGGSDTTATMLLVVIQALTLNPDVLATAHAQMDAVVGEDRSPTWEDYEQLPYIAQIVKEAMRWRPVTPLSFPHALTTDDIIDLGNGEKTFLPAGTTVMLNVWGLHHDEERFPNPDKFDPSRFEGRTKLAAEYAASGDYEARDHYIYGAGRRICPGIHLAEREMWLATAKLVWGFNFNQATDNTGAKIPIDTNPTTGYSEGFLVCPKDFATCVTPRSEKRIETIKREFEKADKEIFVKYRG